jgi:hypothetical protein
MIDIDDS